MYEEPKTFSERAKGWCCRQKPGCTNLASVKPSNMRDSTALLLPGPRKPLSRAMNRDLIKV